MRYLQSGRPFKHLLIYRYIYIAGGMEIQTNIAHKKDNNNWVAPYYACSLSRGKTCPNFAVHYIGQESHRIINGYKPQWPSQPAFAPNGGIHLKSVHWKYIALEVILQHSSVGDGFWHSSEGRLTEVHYLVWVWRSLLEKIDEDSPGRVTRCLQLLVVAFLTSRAA